VILSPVWFARQKKKKKKTFWLHVEAAMLWLERRRSVT